MENQEKNREYQTEKNYINELKKIGFLKSKKSKLSLKEEQFKKKEKILQYEPKEVSQFILKLKNIKIDNERIVKKDLKSKKNEKFPNKFLFKDIGMGKDIKEILLYFLSEEEKQVYYNWIPYINNEKNNYTKLTRKIIRTWKTRYEGTEYINEKFAYIKKINIILLNINKDKDSVFPTIRENIIGNIKSNDNVSLSSIEKILKEKLIKSEYTIGDTAGEELFMYCYHDIMVQLIVYDFLHYNFSEEEKEENFNEIKKFLDDCLNFIKKVNRKTDLIHREGQIYNDFKDFLILNADLLREKQKLEDINLFQEYSLKTEPLSKEKDFLYFLSKQFENLEDIEKNNKKNLIFCGDFLDLDIVKDKVDKITGFSNLNNFQNLEIFKKSDISEILYGNRKPKNNFDKEQEAIQKILLNYPFFSGANLQIKKVITSIVTQEKTPIQPFRKQLKRLITDKNLRNNNRVISIFRSLITREMYKEKGNENGFKKSNILQKEIIDILLRINSIKDSCKRVKIKRKFFEDFFKILVKIQKKKIIICPSIEDLMCLKF